MSGSGSSAPPFSYRERQEAVGGGRLTDKVLPNSLSQTLVSGGRKFTAPVSERIQHRACPVSAAADPDIKPEAPPRVFLRKREAENPYK
jgi:hypothetical protein